jgi:hypothetical protein
MADETQLLDVFDAATFIEPDVQVADDTPCADMVFAREHDAEPIPLRVGALLRQRAGVRAAARVQERESANPCAHARARMRARQPARALRRRGTPWRALRACRGSAAGATLTRAAGAAQGATSCRAAAAPTRTRASSRSGASRRKTTRRCMVRARLAAPPCHARRANAPAHSAGAESGRHAWRTHAGIFVQIPSVSHTKHAAIIITSNGFCMLEAYPRYGCRAHCCAPPALGALLRRAAHTHDTQGPCAATFDAPFPWRARAARTGAFWWTATQGR